jgi:hypothetical protein
MEIERICANCFAFVSPGRWDLGYRLCLSCGEKYAKGDPLPKPVKVPPTEDEIKVANEIRAIEALARKKAALKLVEQHERSIKKRKQVEWERLKKKYGEK